VSIFLHVIGLLALAIFPATAPWVLAALVANHLTFAVAGMCPRSRLLGPNLVRMPHSSARRGVVVLTFDDGPDPKITPQVLDILDCYGAKASFFCIGDRAKAHPDTVREITRRGHSVENHSCRHPMAFALYGLRRMRREVEGGQDILRGITGQSPRFFRAPVGLRSPLLDPVLARAGLRYVGWARRGYDSVSGDRVAILRRLTRNLAAGDVLVLHDGYPARTPSGDPVVLVVLPALLEELAALGLKAVSVPIAVDGEESFDPFVAPALPGVEPSPEVAR
jgi:peptidoglycan/xylan/chitin deacetylase (PgdA/CDA1 family)